MTKPVSAPITVPCPPAYPNRSDKMDTGIVTRQGTMQVKLPPQDRHQSSFKSAWHKRHIIIKSDIIAAVDCITNSVRLEVYKGEKKPCKAAKDEDLIFKKWLTPEKTAIFRSKSRAQSYGFSICVDGQTMIHIAGRSETEAQEWMSAIRVLLWPPNKMSALEHTLGSVFEVSIIDNEHAHRAGLLGMYGHLTITSRKVILTHPQTGHVIQEWYLDTVGFKLLPQSHPDDLDKVVTMLTESRSSTGSGAIIFYCPGASQLIERVHEVRLMFDDKTYGEHAVQDISKLNLGDSYSKYKAPLSITKSVEGGATLEVPRFKFSRPLSESDIIDRDDKEEDGQDEIGPLKSFPMLSRSPNFSAANFGQKSKLFSWSNVSNIPESMLNSSFASSALSRSYSRPLSEASSSNGSNPRLRSLGDEIEGSDEHEQFHLAVARENELLGHDGHDQKPSEEDEVPPPLPPKTRRSVKAASTID